MFRIIIVILVVLISCNDPFFPKISDPVDEVVLTMNTPAETIRRLQQDYEYQNIDHFENTLIYDSTFTYYIQDFFTASNKPENITKSVLIEDEFFIPNGKYLVVNYTEEVELHRKMFESVTDINFSTPLRIEDSTYLNDEQTEILVWTNETYINIKVTAAATNFQATYGDEYEFPIRDQIFHLKLDTIDSQWKIYRWYELN